MLGYNNGDHVGTNSLLEDVGYWEKESEGSGFDNLAKCLISSASHLA